ncbi:cytochrome b-c1 complex subunit 7 isoform X1 [Theropithecus gelada]|uniref:Cytochrome b-c1 complex subunit 7 n=1 Tax=Theropithecus gelada TaxID=9565 RepID=A0A8D2E7I6_THEGE|nr:cytochrome b-c1 complex subunit 7 isoform X1 [Theropithecus gelada]
MAGKQAVSASGKWLDGIRKWYYNAAGFNKLGLLRDDTMYEDEDVKEAIRRLPENLYNGRMFRIKRALDLNLKHQILPKEQWTKYEEVIVVLPLHSASYLDEKIIPLSGPPDPKKSFCEANSHPLNCIETRQRPVDTHFFFFPKRLPSHNLSKQLTTLSPQI